jgi:hypothetical protein
VVVLHMRMSQLSLGFAHKHSISSLQEAQAVLLLQQQVQGHQPLQS